METSDLQSNIYTNNPQKRKRDAESLPARKSPRPPNHEDLCEHCLKLDLQKALFRDAVSNWGYFNNWAVDVGHRYKVYKETNCHLCQMLFASRIDSGGPSSDSVGDIAGEVIRAVSCLTFSELQSYGSQVQIPDDRPFLLILPGKDYNLGENYQKVQDHLQKSGYAAVLGRDKHPSTFVPRKIPEIFDCHTARNWIGYCNKNHRLLCSFESTDMHDVRIIDCEKRSIEKYNPGMPYVALSYVWGKSKAQKLQLRRFQGKRLPDQLSSVIQDSTTVTQAMGFRYLWVDRYCIDQEDPKVKHHQIRQMDAIYGNSELTIIAAAGDDEDFGLSGIGKTRPILQSVAINPEITIVCTPKDP
jgi:hypothetical protein